MKAEDIIKQLQFELPSNTGYFTDELPIFDMFRVGNIVTVVTNTEIAFKTGDYVNIINTNTLTPIISLTNLGCAGDRNNFEAITLTEADLTSEYNKTVSIINAQPQEYNGTFPLVESILYNKFVYSISRDVIGTITKFGDLLENRSFGYNGRFRVTVVNNKTFTYELDYDTPKVEFSNAKVRFRPRISGAVSLNRANESYTRQQDGKYWAYVVLGDTTANKENTIETDAYYMHAFGQNYYQILIINFDIYIFAPSTSSISGRDIRDSMEDVASAIYKSILGVILPNQLSNEGKPDQNSTVTLVSHGFEEYMDAYYIHRFTFSTTMDINNNDTVPLAKNAPFKKMHVEYINDNILCKDVEMTSDIEFNGEQVN